MTNLLCVVGSTGTGKTKLAIELSQLYPSVTISADSRQVYRGMDVVTGKDHPVGVTLFGTDLVEPNEECSVSLWHQAVSPVIKKASEQGKLVIVVGGTGLYFRSLLEGIPTMSIPPNPALRDELSSLSVQELQTRLRQLDAAKLASMNQSDLNNPRRLIRAIEVASSLGSSPIHPPLAISHQPLIIGLKFSDQTIYQDLIHQRVVQRLELGAIKETQDLVAKYPDTLPSFTSLGYRHLIKHLAGELTRSELIAAWTSEEVQYAKRQLTWFSKMAAINWFAADSPFLVSEVATLAKTWYSKNN